MVKFPRDTNILRCLSSAAAGDLTHVERVRRGGREREERERERESERKRDH